MIIYYSFNLFIFNTFLDDYLTLFNLFLKFIFRHNPNIVILLVYVFKPILLLSKKYKMNLINNLSFNTISFDSPFILQFILIKF